MNKEEYQMALQGVYLVAGMLTEFDIHTMLASIKRAEVMGPIIDPTLWIEKERKMREDKELLQAAMPLHQFGLMVQKVQADLESAK
jgi:hypothetical protein